MSTRTSVFTPNKREDACDLIIIMMVESALTRWCSSTAPMSSNRKSVAGRAFLSPRATLSCAAVLQVLSYHATCSKTEVDKFKVTLRIFNRSVDLWKTHFFLTGIQLFSKVNKNIKIITQRRLGVLLRLCSAALPKGEGCNVLNKKEDKRVYLPSPGRGGAVPSVTFSVWRRGQRGRTLNSGNSVRRLKKPTNICTISVFTQQAPRRSQIFLGGELQQVHTSLVN